MPLKENRPNIFHFPALDIEHGGALPKGFVFVVDGHAALPFRAAIVIVGGKFLQIRLEGGLLDCVKIPQIDDFARLKSNPDYVASAAPNSSLDAKLLNWAASLEAEAFAAAC